jgi:hypothetical protein
MKKYISTLLLGACLAVDAQAQSFGDFLKSAVTETAKNIVTNGATKALAPNAGPAQAAEVEAGAVRDAQPALPAGCKRMRGANLSVGPKPDAFEPAILWPENTQCGNGADYSKEFPKMLLALEQGKSLGWKGKKYNVTITATGAQPIGETPCRQFHYTLKQGAKTVSEYDGMYCKWQGAYSSEATWHETV